MGTDPVRRCDFLLDHLSMIVGLGESRKVRRPNRHRSKVHAPRLKVHSTEGRVVQMYWQIMKHLNQADDSYAAFTLILPGDASKDAGSDKQLLVGPH